VIKHVMEAAGGRADGKRVSTKVKEALSEMARRQLEVSNEVAAELAGSRDAALRTLEEQLDCGVYLRGNVITLDGEAESAYRDAGRAELAAQESFVAEQIESYLPAELSDEEIDGLVRAGVESTGASSPRDMGRVIKHVMEAAGGRADGKRVSTKVKEALS
jgi:uncharacterized protein YqeY